MRHTAEKRFLSMFLAMVMILTILPVAALAKSSFNTTVLDGKFTVVTTAGTSGQKAATVNADGSLTMGVTSVTSCTGSFESTANHVVTITNVTAEELMIKFDYGSLTNMGTLVIDNATKTQAGSYSKTVAAGGTIVIQLTSASNANQTSVVLSGFELKDTSTKAVTVTKTDNGSVTVNGTALSAASVTVNADYATGVTVAATPASGYTFLAWLDSNYQVVSTEANTVIQPLEDMIVGAFFVPNDTQAYWLANNTLHTDLGAACTAAQQGDKTVVLIKNGTLPSGTHTIPAGIHVLIPFDDAYTSYGTGDPELAPNNSSQKFVTPTAYRTLTMASGSTLVVNGTLELAAKHHVSAGHDTGSNGGAIWGKYGHINMADNSKIAVNGTLCAWGVVSGSGEVVANSGAYIYEKMQIADYRGGSATSSLATTYSSRKLFPFSQYYVQNVEVKETIHAGATLMVNVGVYLSAAEQSTIAFVGPAGSMFTLGTGAYVTKQYDAANDRLKLDAYGNTTLSSISLSFEGQSVNSASFRLGLNNNIDIHVHTGLTTISQDVVLQAGATVTVDREAAIYNTAELFVMDAEDWGTFARGKTIIPVMWSYANGRTVKRTTVSDAIVNINGTIINGGQLYSTGADSFISSEKTGVIVYNSPANSSATLYQLDHNSFTLGMTSDWEQLTCTPAILVNGDKTTVTASGAQYDAFIYDSFEDKWIQKNLYNGGSGYAVTATYDSNGGSGTVPAPTVVDYMTQVGAFAQTGTLAPLSFALPEAELTREGFDFIGWSNDPNATVAQFVPGDYAAISADTTVYAVWEGKSFALTVDGVSQDVAYGTDLSGLLTEPSKDGYVFTGWTAAKADGTAVELPATMPAYDLVITANFRQLQKYTLSFLNENGEVISSTQVLEGAAISAPAYSKEGYSFLGWINTATGAVETVASVMPQSNLEYQASMKINTYTIKFLNGTTEVGEVTVNHGEQATLIGALTDANAVFMGWGETADTAKYEAGATIDVSGNMTLYAVWHTHTPEAIPAVEATCTATGLTEGSKCSVCKEILVAQETVPMKPHTEAIDAAVEATCTATGLTEGKHCSVCNKVLVAQEVVDMKPHTEAIDAAVEATCTATGLTEGKHCSVCNKVLVAQEVVEMKSHNYEAKVTVAPGCESAGTKTFTCTVCGDSYSEPLAATGHKYVAQTPVAPTCTEDGYTVYACACGHSYQDDPVAALGHTEVIDAAVEATCTATGLTEGKHCSVCGEILVAQEVVDMKPHTEVIDAAVEATCTSTGLTEGKHCSVCGEILVAQEVIPVLGHTEVIDAAVEATCTSTGLTEGKHCADCGKVLVAQEVVDMKPHTEVIDAAVEATCTSTGLTEGKHCSVCGEILVAQEVVDMKPHTEVIDAAVEATCTATGLTEGKHCSVCNKVLVAQNEIPANGHSFVNGGCENCDAEIQVSLPGSFNGWDTNAWIMTRNEDGTYTYEVRLEADRYTFKVMDDGNWLGNGGDMYDTTDGNAWIFDNDDGDCTLIASGGTYTFTYNINNKTLVVEAVLDHVHDYDATYTWSDYYTTCSLTLTCDCNDSFTNTISINKSMNNGQLFFVASFGEYSDTVTVEPVTTNVVYVDVSYMGWTNVNAYYWKSTSTQGVINWPGIAMTHVRDSVYCIEVPADCDRIIFNNGSSQTNDLQMPTLGENIAVVKSLNTTDWGYMTPPNYSITFTDEPGQEMADWSYTITKPYGAPITEEDLVALEAAIPTIEYHHVVSWYLPDNQNVEIPETMPGYDQTFYAHWEGVRSIVNFYNYQDMTYLSAAEFLYGETYYDLGIFVSVNCIDEYTPEGYHVAAIKYADGTNLEFPYVHGAEGLDMYIEFAINACDVHTEQTVSGYPATCTEPGLTDGVKCSVCGEIITAQEEIAALGHTEETVPGYDATCTETGLTDGAKCSVCGEITVAQEEIPAKGHSFVDGICSVCGAEQYMTIYFQNNWLWSDVKLHFWGSETDPNPEWEGVLMTLYGNDGNYDYYVMEVPTDIDGMLINGIKNDGTGTLDKTPDITSGWYDGICYYLYWENGGNKAGSFDIAGVNFPCEHIEEAIPGTPATCTETGLTDGVKCSVCDEILTAQEVIPALGHGHTEGISYEEGDGTHDVFCDDCYTTIAWNVECTYSEDTHACVCGNVESFTIEWYDFGTFKSETYKYGETVIGPEPVSEVTDKGKNTFLFWYDLSDGTEVTLPMTMPAKNLQLQAAYSYTGWAGAIGSDYYTFWIDSMEVQGWFNVNENNEPVGEGEGERYYAGEDYNVVNNITLIDGVYYAFDRDTGAFLSDYTGIYEASGGHLYYVENGIAVKNKGLVKTTDENGHIHYYYFGCGANNCSASPCNGEYKAQKSNRHYAEITNGLLVPGGYTIDKYGVIEHIDDTSVNGIYEIDGVKYCLMDGVKVAMGLFEENGSFYYARSSGELVINQNYWVSKTNGLTHNGEAIKNGTYFFDENGALVFPEPKNGFYYENDGWYYYVDDAKNYAGLIWCDGPEGNDPGYYYVNSQCKLVTDCAYWISKNNGYMKNTTYYFDENGTMYTPAPKEGFYFEDGAWYYYVDGKLNYAGLIWCDGPEGNDPGYYYVNSQCKLVTDCTYWISKNNGYMGNQNYVFDENGTMVQETDDSNELLNGFVEEDGELYYYVNGLKTYAGLILVDGDYYYVNSKGKVVRDCTYWISKNNGYMKNGNYTFDAEGKMVQG